MTERLDLLLFCQKHFGPVFPIYGVIETPNGLRCECGRTCLPKNAGKHVRLPGKQCEVASSDPEQLERWFQQFPFANYAIRTGEPLLVIDVDMTQAKDGVSVIQTLDLPATPKVLSGRNNGSNHLYFKRPDGFFKHSRREFLPGLDMKCINQYVVAPGSRHLTGGYYRFDGNSQSLPLALPPDSLVQLLLAKSARHANNDARTPAEPRVTAEMRKHLPKPGKLASDAIVKGVMFRNKVARRLMLDGHISKDWSKDDLRLCSLLAFYTKHNLEQALHLFYDSALFRPKFDKLVDENKEFTYAEWTMRLAFLNNPGDWRPTKRKKQFKWKAEWNWDWRNRRKRVPPKKGRKPSKATCAILYMHLLNPEWNPQRLADELQLTSGHVRKVLHGHRMGKYREVVEEICYSMQYQL